MRSLFVFWATGRPCRWPGPLRLLQLSCRRPRRSWMGFVSLCVRFFSRSPWAHVCVGTTDCVLDPSSLGDRFWPTQAFIPSYPSLACMIEIRVPSQPTFAATDKRHRRVIPTLARWLVCTSTTSRRRRDCLAVVCRTLEECGVQFDRNIRTMEQLRRWLDGQGCRTVWIEHPAHLRLRDGRGNRVP